ncbi:MAG TPA: DUF2236 domain-containing protein [Candidatus Poseidoniaceae archaeon]|nr:DUF2236 domain-containing protein [Candidatus Poseidoniaceae archaeon]
MSFLLAINFEFRGFQKLFQYEVVEISVAKVEWDEETLSALRLRMDPSADEIVNRIAKGGAIEETNRMLRSIIMNHQEVPSGLPSYLYDWLNESCQLPDWVDMERIRGANKFFREDGPSISLFACTTGFLWMYACANGSKVLSKSRRLSEDTERRIAETAQFILEVSQKGGLEPDGGGLRMIQKVRLMHSSIRWFIHNKGDWDYETWGAPINQEDMLGTIMVIGAQVLEDMQKMGIKMKKKHMDDWWYLWRAIGEVMGVEPELLPVEREEASRVTRIILDHQLQVDQDSIDLTRSLLDFFEVMIPGKIFDGVINSIIRQTMGKELSDKLEVPSTRWERIIGRKTFKILGFADFISGPFGGIVERLAISFVNGKSRKILNKEPAEFSMSNNLRSAFQRKSLEVIDAFELMWEDGQLSEEEVHHLNELQQQLALSDKEMKRFATLGAINAAISDEVVEPKEIELIRTLAQEAELPDEKISLILDALKDGRVDADEREMLNHLLGHA